MFFFLSCVCFVFVRVCLFVLGKGWPFCSRLWCIAVSLSLPIGYLSQMWYLIYRSLIFAPLLTLLSNSLDQRLLIRLLCIIFFVYWERIFQSYLVDVSNITFFSTMENSHTVGNIKISTYPHFFTVSLGVGNVSSTPASDLQSHPHDLLRLFGTCTYCNGG